MFIILLQGVWVTVQISLIAIFLGLCFGTILGALNNDNIKLVIITPIIQIYVSVIRGTPIFVQLLIVYFARPNALHVNISPFIAGIITLSLNSTAYLAETVRAGINSVPLEQWESTYILGYSQIKTLRYIILPQAIKKILPAITNELIALIKESSILMIIGVQELTKTSREIVARELNPMKIYFFTAALYFIITFTLSQLTKYLYRG
jgi:His/Glu/Gln/Arg/opine family amino acid ABC transporter permease subunit